MSVSGVSSGWSTHRATLVGCDSNEGCLMKCDACLAQTRIGRDDVNLCNILVHRVYEQLQEKRKTYVIGDSMLEKERLTLPVLVFSLWCVILTALKLTGFFIQISPRFGELGCVYIILSSLCSISDSPTTCHCPLRNL